MLMEKLWIAEEHKDKMVYRRRCPGICTFVLFSCATLIILLVSSMLYGTRTMNPSLPPLVKEILPAGRCLCESSTNFACDTCLDCVSNQVILATNTSRGVEQDQWVFKYPQDRNNYSLDDEQCESAFPGQYEDIERAVKTRDRLGKVVEDDLSSFKLTKGMVRGMIFERELYIIETMLADDVNRQKAIASLAALYRAIRSAPPSQSLPNVEFVFSVEDLPAQPKKPIWQLARRVQDTALWLIPDFGFWAWDVQALGTLDEVAMETLEREKIESWDRKTEKLIWRGKVTFAPKLRRALLDAAKGKPWSDVGQVKWGNANFKQEFLGPVDQCNYMFIAHAEGRSYSGSLKYRQLCRSVIISHKLQWIQHYHYLFRNNGSNQNFVEVERDFSDLSAAMEDLLDHPEKAKRIADNSVRTFRERYLTQAAEACYWRRLIKRWKSVMAWEPELYHRDAKAGDSIKRGQKRGVRFETFILYDFKTQVLWPKATR